MKGQDVLMSSGDTTGSPDWATPWAFFNLLDSVLGHFELDAAATQKTAKCGRYYSSVHNALEQPWKGVVFCNPPYGRGVGAWITKGYVESRQPYCNRVVMLLPARTDLVAFHDTILPYATAVLFVRGRIRFKLPGKKDSATFPSMVVLFDDYRDSMSKVPDFGSIVQPSKGDGGRVEYRRRDLASV